jgi:hypothetical protein
LLTRASSCVWHRACWTYVVQTSRKTVNSMREHHARRMRSPSASQLAGLGTFILLGQKKAVAIAVKNVSGRRRWSKLREWLNPV